MTRAPSLLFSLCRNEAPKEVSAHSVGFDSQPTEGCAPRAESRDGKLGGESPCR